MIRQQFFSAFVLTIAIANGGIAPHILLPTRVLALENRSLPDPPDKPPPNRTKPGGGLDPNRGSCNSPDRYLTALVPVENPVLTTSAHPTLLFYVPDRAEDVRYGEFLINTQDEERVGQIVRFQLPNTPGIVSVSLPELPENALQEGQRYHWFFKLFCSERSGSKTPVISVSGRMRRVPRTPENDLAIANATTEIWYDAIASLAQQILAAPQDSVLRERWLNLLQSIDEEALAEQPILGSVRVTEE